MTNLSANAAETSNPATLPDSEKPFKQLVREAFAAGKTRSEIAKEHGVTYQRVFSITKGMPNPDGSESAARPRAVLPDGTPRVEKIRELFAEGKTVGMIAKELNCSYQIVYQATKKQRAALTENEAPTGEEVEETETELEDDEDEEEDEDEDSDEEDEEE